MRILFFLIVLGLFSCKKEDTSPSTTSVSSSSSVKKSTIHYFIKQYDAYGSAMADRSGIQIKLLGTSFVDTTDASGYSRMDSVPQGIYSLLLAKSGYDVPSLSINFNANSPLSYNTFIAEPSTYSVTSFSANVYSLDSVTVSFTLLGNPIPSGKTVAVEVLLGNNSSLSVFNFTANTKIQASGLNVVNYNIAKDFFMYYGLSQLSSNQFYLKAVPVSYGVLLGNGNSQSQIIGESNSPSSNIMLTKNW